MKNKLQLIATQGLPGSGKDYWCEQVMKEQPNVYKRINKDAIRFLLDFSVWSGSNEKFIVKARDVLIELALQNGKSVICTDTNFNLSHITRFKEIAEKYKAEFFIQDFTQVPFETCIERDRTRSASVGKGVILQMWAKYLKPKPVEYIEGLPDAIIMDLDGSLCIFGNANPYERNFLEDKINPSLKMILEWKRVAENKYPKTELILVSGRKDIYRDQTEQWLKNNDVDYDFLYMRKTAPEGQNEPKDTIVKKEIYDTYINGKYNILGVFDDRPQVVRLWKSLGLFVFDVGDGVEF